MDFFRLDPEREGVDFMNTESDVMLYYVYKLTKLYIQLSYCRFAHLPPHVWLVHSVTEEPGFAEPPQ